MPRPPDIVMVSNRLGRSQLSTTSTHEFEDVLAELLGARLVCPPSTAHPVARGAQVLRHRSRALLQDHRTDGTGDEVAITVIQGLTDLRASYAVAGRVGRARQRIAIIEELWPSDLPLARHVRAFLRTFDLVTVGQRCTVGPLQEHLDVPVSYLAPSVDALAATRGPAPDRAIDVYSMGRRTEAVHERLLARADRTGQLYLYSTWSGNAVVHDHAAHRHNLRGRIRRSRYFMVQEARFDDTERVQDELEVGLRYVEGAAGGAVMLGTRPHGPGWDEMFPWQAVVEVARDGSDLDDVLDALDADPEKQERISRANTRGVLANHDIAHRARWLVATCGLPVTERLERRLEELHDQVRQAP